MVKEIIIKSNNPAALTALAKDIEKIDDINYLSKFMTLKHIDREDQPDVIIFNIE